MIELPCAKAKDERARTNRRNRTEQNSQREEIESAVPFAEI